MTEADRPSSARGAAFLGSRYLLNIFAGLLVATLLARWMKPSDFGQFETLNIMVLGVCALIGDLGITMSLVRQPNEPSNEDWTAALRVVGVISFTSVIAINVVAGLLAGLGHDRLGLSVTLLSLALSARLTRPICSARLQRDTRFSTLALVETAELLTYYGIVLALASAGAGMRALLTAVVLKEIVGAFLLWRVAGPKDLQPSKPSRATYRALLAVGVPAQASGLLIALTDAFMPLFIGTMLGASALGYVSWAYNLALMPILLISTLDRVVLPALARVQDTPEVFASLVNRTIRLNCLVAFPLMLIIITCHRDLVEILYGAQWRPAEPLLLMFVPAILTTAMNVPVIHAFNAMGRVRVAALLAAGWLASTWTAGALCTYTWGILGFGVFYIALQLLYIPVWIYAHRHIGVSVLRQAAPAALALFVATVIGTQIQTRNQWEEVTARIAISIITFYVTVIIARPNAFASDTTWLTGSLLSRTCRVVVSDTAKQRIDSFVEPSGQLRKLQPLQGLRAVAVLMVLASHFAIPHLESGTLGVDIFFVLSGFLIATLLRLEIAQTGTVDLFAFYKRRIRRLTPLLFTVIAATVIAVSIVPVNKAHETLQSIWVVLLYLGAFAHSDNSKTLGLFGPMWSLSVEEVFYAAFPLLLVLCTKRKWNTTRVVIGSTLFAIMYRIPWVTSMHVGNRLYYAPDMRAEQLLMGCALAFILAKPSAFSNAARLCWSVCGVGLVVFLACGVVWRWTEAEYFAGGSTAVAFLAAGFIGWTVTSPASFPARGLSLRPLVWLGERSYGIYLWHYPVIGLAEYATTQWLHVRWTFAVVSALLITIALSDLSFRFIERPWRRASTKNVEQLTQPANVNAIA